MIAYIDPSAMTYLIQIIAGVAIAIGAAITIWYRKAKKKVSNKLGIDENRNKEVESDEIVVKATDKVEKEEKKPVEKVVKNTTVKKTTAKKSATKKPATKKTTTAKKPAAKKATTTKTTAKKTTTKKPATKKTTSTKKKTNK